MAQRRVLTLSGAQRSRRAHRIHPGMNCAKLPELSRECGRPRMDADEVLAALKFDRDGLVAAVAQQHDTGEVLMLAWMDRAAVEETLATGHAVYWSRSRRQRWRKGDTSGHGQ